MLIFVDFENVGLVVSLVSLFSLLLFLHIIPVDTILYLPLRFMIYYHTDYDKTLPISITSYCFYN